MNSLDLINEKMIVNAIKKLPEVKTPIMDVFFPKANRRAHMYPYIAHKLAQKLIGNVPVVSRDSSSVSAGQGGSETTLIVPMPIKLKEFLSDARLNDLRSMGQDAIQSEIDSIISDMRYDIRLTAEALCAQALVDGKINYWMDVDGKAEKYGVDYQGKYPSFAASKKWGTDSTTLDDIASDLDEMAGEIQKAGGLGPVVFACGKDVFTAIRKKMNNENQHKATLKNGVIEVDGYLIHRISDSYKTGNKKTDVAPKIPAKYIVGSAVENNHLRYCSLDDAEAKFKGLPFFAKTKRSEDPDGVKIFGQSKPFPLPTVATCIKSQVLS